MFLRHKSMEWTLFPSPISNPPEPWANFPSIVHNFNRNNQQNHTIIKNNVL